MSRKFLGTRQESFFSIVMHIIVLFKVDGNIRPYATLVFTHDEAQTNWLWPALHASTTDLVAWTGTIIMKCKTWRLFLSEEVYVMHILSFFFQHLTITASPSKLQHQILPHRWKGSSIIILLTWQLAGCSICVWEVLSQFELMLYLQVRTTYIWLHFQTRRLNSSLNNKLYSLLIFVSQQNRRQ